MTPIVTISSAGVLKPIGKRSRKLYLRRRTSSVETRRLRTATTETT